MRETNTIEFRHFPGTMDAEELRCAFTWVHNYTIRALQGSGVQDLISHKNHGLPKFLPYNHEQEKRYRMTCHDGSLKKSEIAANIEKILEEDTHEHFDETP